MKIKAKSLDFRLKRGDFEKWVSDILEDENGTGNRGRKRQKLRAALRNRLYDVVSKRDKEWTAELNERAQNLSSNDS